MMRPRGPEERDIYERLPEMVARLREVTAELERFTAETRRDVPAGPQGGDDDRRS